MTHIDKHGDQREQYRIDLPERISDDG